MYGGHDQVCYWVIQHFVYEDRNSVICSHVQLLYSAFGLKNTSVQSKIYVGFSIELVT
jgi:hypothetical protein